MNKQEIVDEIAKQADISKNAAEVALDAFTGCVTSTLARGGKVAITNWGSFEVGHRAARTGRNPQTGQPIHIAASSVAKFKAGKKLKEAVNEGNSGNE